jgi:hypothetical protein
VVAELNRTVQTPRVASVADVTTVLVPAIYAVGAEQVIVALDAVLLYIEIKSPSLNVDVGITIAPEAPS